MPLLRLGEDSCRLRGNADNVERFSCVVDKGLAEFRERLVSEFCKQIGCVLPGEPKHQDEREYASSQLSEEIASLADEAALLGTISNKCGTLGVESHMIPSLPPIKRWRDLIVQMMRPTARANLVDEIVPKFRERACWLEYLTMFRNNQENCRVDYASAKESIVKGRKELMMKGRKGIAHSATGKVFKELGASFVRNGMILHPHSPSKKIWTFISLLILLYDAITLPLCAFFDLQNSSFLNINMWVSSIFWLLDIAVSFRSGRDVHGSFEMRAHKIAGIYLRSWMPFDVVAAMADWTLLFLDIVTGEYATGSVSVATPTIRFMRLLCLVRLLKLKMMMEYVLAVNIKQIIIFSPVIKASVIYMLYFHLLGCAWYEIGISNSGWTVKCETLTVAQCYFASIQSLAGHIFWISNAAYTSTPELVFSTCSFFIGMLLLAVFIALMVNALGAKASDRKDVHIMCAAYAKRRHLSSRLSLRLLQYAKDVRMDLEKQLRQEQEMFQNIPLSLQIEILHETRKPLIAGASIVKDLDCVSPSITKKLCTDATSSTIAILGEAIFLVGDVGYCWRLVESGKFDYVTTSPLQDSIMMSSSIKMPHLTSYTASQDVSRNMYEYHYPTEAVEEVGGGSSISEMILWTPWTHSGDLIATCESLLLSISPEGFAEVIKGRVDTCLIASIHARHYVKALNNSNGDGISDLYQYRTSVADLQEYESERSDKSVQHYKIFLSHYKAEAGTEATLMQEALHKMLAEGESDGWTSVFLDSEDLTDLSELKEHVMRSENLVLLLTPGVLSRPWCLMEIAIAKKHGAQIVPVEIQRPGFKFAYPDERFYNKLRNGEILTKRDLIMLVGEGITLELVEDSLRFLFQQIALPFSPHKSKNIRMAELGDIVTRCLSHRKPKSQALSEQQLFADISFWLGKGQPVVQSPLGSSIRQISPVSRSSGGNPTRQVSPNCQSSGGSPNRQVSPSCP